MSAQQQSTTEEQSDESDEEYETRAWGNMTPHTRMKCNPEELIFGGDLSGSEAQNGTSFGLVAGEPSTVIGDLWVNQAKADDGTTADGIDDDDPRPTDYRIVDPDDNSTTIANGALVTDEAHGTYDEADGFTDDEVLFWFNGMSGERVGRVLDANGLPFASYTDDGSYLVKGLMQVASGWRDANSDKRREMKENGLAPRVARQPILRDDIDGDILIDLSRYQGGRAYEIHIFDADAFEDEFGSLDAEIPRNDSGYVDDVESEISFRYTDDADEILDDNDVQMQMFEGDGWEDRPDNYEAPNTQAGGELVIEADTTEVTEEQVAEQYDTFVETVCDALPDGQTPEQAFDGGLEGLIDSKASWFYEVPDEEATEEIRADIYAATDWLDASDLN